MNRLQKIVLLLTFYLSDWGAAKAAEWEDFTGDLPFSEDTFMEILKAIADETDEDLVDWTALDTFKDNVSKSLN